MPFPISLLQASRRHPSASQQFASRAFSSFCAQLRASSLAHSAPSSSTAAQYRSAPRSGCSLWEPPLYWPLLASEQPASSLPRVYFWLWAPACNSAIFANFSAPSRCGRDSSLQKYISCSIAACSSGCRPSVALSLDSLIESSWAPALVLSPSLPIHCAFSLRIRSLALLRRPSIFSSPIFLDAQALFRLLCSNKPCSKHSLAT